MTARMSVGLIAVLGIVCYANSFRNEFVWDDAGQIVHNRLLRSWEFAPRFFTSDVAEAYGTGTGSGHFYRPLWMLSQLVDFQLWGPNPVGFHATNFLLHLANALLVFALMMRLGIQNRYSLLAAALFVSHPASTETTTFIAGRTGEMSVLFMLASLLLFLGFMKTPHWWLLAGSAAGFSLALLSKEIAVTLIGIIAAAGLLLGPLRRRDWLMIVGVFGCVLCGYLLVRELVLAQPNYPAQFDWSQRFVLMLRALAAHVVFTVAPHNLHMDRNLMIDGWRGSALTAAGVGTLVVMGLIGLWSYRRQRTIAFGLVFFAMAFSVTSNLFELNVTFAERWVYWPMIGLLISLGAALNRRAGRTVIVLGWIVVGVFSGQTIAQNRVWRNERTLFETTIARGGGSMRVRVSLASAYMDAGDFARAREQLEEALRHRPQDVMALRGMGTLLATEKQLPEAKGWLVQAAKVAPEDVATAIWLAYVQEQLGELPEAEQTLRTSVERAASPTPALKLTEFYLRAGRLDDAERSVQTILDKEPMHAAAQNLLGTVLFRRGEVDEAEKHFRLALRYDRWLVGAHANLAAVANERGDLNETLSHYDDALRLDPTNASIYYALGVVLSRHRQVVEARRVLARAVELDPRFDAAKKLLEELTSHE